MTVVQILEAVLDLLDSPEKWAKGDAAQDVYGDSIELESPEAVSWCLAGAMCKVSEYDNLRQHPTWVGAAMDFLTKRCYADYGTASIPIVNDIKLVDYEDMRMFVKRALLEAEELNI